MDRSGFREKHGKAVSKTIYKTQKSRRARKKEDRQGAERFWGAGRCTTVRNHARAEVHSPAISDIHIKMNPNFPDPRKLPACISLYINKPIGPHHINAGVNRLNSELGRFQ